MISLDIKSDAKTSSSSSSSPLNLSTPSDEPAISFSQLLKGVSESKDDKIIQNGSLILSLGDSNEASSKDPKSSTKMDTLLGLLKSEENLAESDVKVKSDSVELNQKLVENLNTKDMKLLVADAKDYLKNKIKSSDDYKLAEAKELPKTLKGLADMAKKLDIDLSKITIEEVQTKQELDKLAKVESIPTKEIPKEQELKVKESPIRDILQNKIDIKERPKQVGVEKETPKQVELSKQTPKQVELSKEIPKQVEIKNDKPKSMDIKLNSQVEDSKDVDIQAPIIKTVAKKTIKQDSKLDISLDTKTDTKEKTTNTSNTDVDVDILKEQKIDDKYSKVSKELKATPLFKAQESVQVTSTEQIVQVKSNSAIDTNIKTAKDRADETLKLLLRGEKPTIKESGFTADFSVATAKVIAPEAMTDSRKAVESLLHGESTNSSSKDVDNSIDGLNTHKADSFEVKLNEAKQMVKYLSNDVKTAIEDYKSPFTRVKVQLNPQQLGEVDLTIVQRGKNLHVNISSNNAAINTLALNANDLKVQLANNGINNASLNFNNNGQDSQNAQQGQQNRQQGRQANEEYNYFDKEEANEEILTSLEIIVPQYG